MAHSKEKKKLTETIPEEDQMVGLKRLKEIKGDVVKAKKMVYEQMRNIKKETENTRINQKGIQQLKSTITSSPKELKICTGRRISDLDDRAMETITSKEQKGKRLEGVNSLRGRGTPSRGPVCTWGCGESHKEAREGQKDI